MSMSQYDTTNFIKKFSHGRIQTGEYDCTWIPDIKNGRPPVLLLHGAGDALGMFNPVKWASAGIGDTLARYGFTVIAGEMAGNAFHNATGMARMSTALTSIASIGGVTSGECYLVGASMGGGMSVQWAKQNLTKARAIYNLMPLCDLNDIYVNNKGGLRASIETAWGVSYPTALPAESNLLTGATAIRDAQIPVRMIYSDADALITVSSINAMATALGATAIEHDPANWGHTELGINEMSKYGEGDWADMVEFLMNN